MVIENLLSAVIRLPDNMFEATSIPVCVIVFDKEKKDKLVTFIDHSKIFETVKRKQRGQFGGKSHTSRVYKKENKVISDEMIKNILDCIKERKTEKSFCASVKNDEILKSDEVKWIPGQFIEEENPQKEYLPIKEILDELARIGEERNVLKLTINENLAKQFGIELSRDLINKSNETIKEINEKTGKYYGVNIPLADYYTTTKKAGQIQIENKNKKKISSIFKIIIPMYKQHLYYLNSEENRLLAKLRDCLIYELIGNGGEGLPEKMREEVFDEK